MLAAENEALKRELAFHVNSKVIITYSETGEIIQVVKFDATTNTVEVLGTTLKCLELKQ